MPDLTDADLEAMEKRCEAATKEWSDVRFSLSTVGPGPLKWTHSHAKWYMDNLPALIAALREARGERDGLRKVAEAAKALRSEHRADFMDDGARQDRLCELFQLLDEHDEAAALAELDAGEGTC